jgi:PEP-CTERM motif-containing protein
VKRIFTTFFTLNALFLAVGSATTIVDADCCANGTMINTYFPGVTLSVSTRYGGDHNVYVFTTPVNSTSPNVFGHNLGGVPPPPRADWFFYDGGPVLRADFGVPVSFVSLDFIQNTRWEGDPDTDVGDLELYTAGGTLLKSLSTSVLSFGAIETLSWNSFSPNIAYILAGGSRSTGDDIFVDHLVYRTSAIPEPTTIGLVALGLAGIALGRRHSFAGRRRISRRTGP